MKSPKALSKSEALAKAQRFCAYQERCHSELRGKLLDWGVYGDTLEEILADLIAEGFLNEERFACTFARGKFRIKGWGRIRIERELRMRQVSDYCIRKAMQEIPDDEYKQALEQQMRKKAAESAGADPFQLKAKLLRHASQRGFETELAWEILDRLELE